jgi:hypothetical protein
LPAYSGLDDLADSVADEPPLLPESEVGVLLLDASFPDAARGSFDEPSLDEPSLDEPSFDGVFEGALGEEESELPELRESVL